MAGGRQGEENVTFSTCKNLMCSLVSWWNFSDHVSCDKGEGLAPHQYTVDIQLLVFSQSDGHHTRSCSAHTQRCNLESKRKKRQHKNQSQLDMKG